jgi:hypothetical protein
VNYRLVYDVSQESPPWGFAAFGLLFVVIGVGLFVLRHRLPPTWVGAAPLPAWSRTAFSGAFLGFALLWTVVASVSIGTGHAAAQRALREGRVEVVEGTVEDFHPMPASGHDTERFTVKGVHFEYSDFVVRSAFRNTSSHGGPIREGLQVRISWFGSPSQAEILKLEVAE